MRFCAAMVVFFAALLALDQVAGRPAQLALGAVTLAILLLACRRLPPERRSQAAVVVAVATCFELVGSVIWGVYRYRLGNLPAFVPPAHGLVYLTGLALSQTKLVLRFPRGFVAAVVAAALAWGVAGVTFLPRTDVIGAFGVLVFCALALRGGAATVLGGVFLAVAALELYGTAIGTWEWSETVPGLGLASGNPPSGAASGYVLFDLVAIALAPRLLARVRAARGRISRPDRREPPIRRRTEPVPG